jgi:hypothetical protein
MGGAVLNTLIVGGSRWKSPAFIARLWISVDKPKVFRGKLLDYGENFTLIDLVSSTTCR